MSEPGSLETQTRSLSLPGSVTLGRTLQFLSFLRGSDSINCSLPGESWRWCERKPPVMSALGKDAASALQYLYLAAEGAHCPGTHKSRSGPLRCRLGGHQTRCGYPSSGHS